MNEPVPATRRSHAPHVAASAWRQRGRRGVARGEALDYTSLALESGVRVRVAGHEVAPLGSPGMSPGSCFSPGFAAPFARRAATRAPARREVAPASLALAQLDPDQDVFDQTGPRAPESVRPRHGHEDLHAAEPLSEEPLPRDEPADDDLLGPAPLSARFMLAAAAGVSLAAAFIGLTLNLAGPSTIVAGAMLIMGSGLALLVASRERTA